MPTVTPRPFAKASDEHPDSGHVTLESAELVRERDSMLTRILRRRRRPLLLVIDSDGELLFSSISDSAPASEQRLLGQALAEAHGLFHWQDKSAASIEDQTRSFVDGQGQRSVLIALGKEFFCLRVIRLHGVDDDSEEDQYAALIEPIVEPLAKNVDFEQVKQKYRLSTREGDVLEALMSGDKDKEIAAQTGLTTGTVRSYLKSIRAKLGVTTRTAIVNVVHNFASEGPANNNGR